MSILEWARPGIPGTLRPPPPLVPRWFRVAKYERRQPEQSLLHQVIGEQIESFLSSARERDAPVAYFVERELRAYLNCGVLAHGFLRVRCDGCGHDRLVAFSCKGRGFCPSCGDRRMAWPAPRYWYQSLS